MSAKWERKQALEAQKQRLRGHGRMRDRQRPGAKPSTSVAPADFKVTSFTWHGSWQWRSAGDYWNVTYGQRAPGSWRWGECIVHDPLDLTRWLYLVVRYVWDGKTWRSERMEFPLAFWDLRGVPGWVDAPLRGDLWHGSEPTVQRLSSRRYTVRACRVESRLS